jgi:hypothetical protein
LQPNATSYAALESFQITAKYNTRKLPNHCQIQHSKASKSLPNTTLESCQITAKYSTRKLPNHCKIQHSKAAKSLPNTALESCQITAKYSTRKLPNHCQIQHSKAAKSLPNTTLESCQITAKYSTRKLPNHCQIQQLVVIWLLTADILRSSTMLMSTSAHIKVRKALSSSDFLSMHTNKSHNFYPNTHNNESGCEDAPRPSCCQQLTQEILGILQQARRQRFLLTADSLPQLPDS